MKKQLLTGILALGLAFTANAQQWGGSTSTTGTITRSGPVGIGTSTVASGTQFQVDGLTRINGDLIVGSPNGMNFSTDMDLGSIQFYSAWIEMEANVLATKLYAGSGPAMPTDYVFAANGKSRIGQLSINSDIIPTGFVFNAVGSSRFDKVAINTTTIPTGFTFAAVGGANFDNIAINTTTIPTNYNFAIGGNTYMNGQLAINTTCVPSGYSVAVKGKIVCEELKVKLENSNCWGDYVFEKDYNLLKLDSLENYLQANKHLPNVPSADALVQSGGVSVGEMQAIQMVKIEELHLYILELHNQNQELRKRLEELEASIQR